MAKSLLPFASFSGADPDFSVDHEGWRSLEAAYANGVFPGPARERLAAIGRAYLADRRTETVWQSYRDVEALLPAYDKAAKAIWAIAYENHPRSDASSELESILERALASEPLRIQPARGDLLFLTGELEEWTDFGQLFQAPEGAYAVRFGLDLIREMAMNFRVALTKAEHEIQRRADESRNDRRQTATERLILLLVGWAKAFGFHHAPYIDGTEPAPFARFVRAFLTLVPSSFREERDLTDAALAAQIKRVKSADKAHKREQEQARLAKANAPLGSDNPL
ncbi:hypothetical protein LHFGNBLO_001331 [Mesorhizobium sp. AR10]|uniref:hypothetical protein n=1 Tax=Mesorhizobium sp. AR10 TaxID=2865839 RepID=UPI00215E5A74|nr:hypothetical protein [Mesorhizobium sp. AR10]UVK39916.1 hypothetical protein LHFGNBLO_001331 [Mesorhizobium sp. AR10]